MMKTREGTRSRAPSRIDRAVLLLLPVAGVVGQTGCGREFFRQWADQDVSEAIFEKSRDPRWRLDWFSIEPPAMSRFANAYDPERPPAPPDDTPTEAMSPRPQDPDHRLLTPAEGTGYLVMLEEWERARAQAPAPSSNDRAPEPPEASLGSSSSTDTPPAEMPRPDPPPSPAPSPFSNARDSAAPADLPRNPYSQPALPPTYNVPGGGGANPGTKPRDMSPIKPRDDDDPPPPPTPSPTLPPAVRPRPEANTNTPPGAQSRLSPRDRRLDGDREVKRVRLAQEPSTTPAPAPGNERAQNPSQTPEPPSRPGAPSNPNSVIPDLDPRFSTTPEGRAAGRALLGGESPPDIINILIPKYIRVDDAQAAGLPKGSLAYKVSMDQAVTLALMNSRGYQNRLEQLYTSALPVTLQRFTFQPQFALATPTANVANGLGVGAGNNAFLYRTLETGSQQSALNLGTVAAVGKAFSNGSRLAASLATSVVFNFTGRTPRQPTVQSTIPITLVIPFLRNGGRAATLEPLTQAERNLVYEVRNFAKFRQEFITSMTTGAGFTVGGGPGAADPNIGFLRILQGIERVEIDRRNIAAFELISSLFKELISGEASGLTQLQIDQVESNIRTARQSLSSNLTAYRADIDAFKLQMGLPPDVPIVPERGLLARFGEVFENFNVWQLKKDRKVQELDEIVKGFPDLEDVSIDDRSLLAHAPGERLSEDLENLLLAAERVALENRLDIMNARAQLMDSWRQIRVAANQLKGAFNVNLTNQVLTPPTTTNPFAFVDQAKTFSLVFNAELPLVRLAERNNFRNALINYQRQRRALQAAEDQVKLDVRNGIRNLHLTYEIYTIARDNLVITLRARDNSFETLVAPPQQGGGGGTNAAIQTQNVILAQNNLAGIQFQLIQNWVNYQRFRVTLIRDLGILPYDEWEAFHELFPTKSTGPRVRPAAGDGTPGNEEAAPEEVGS